MKRKEIMLAVAAAAALGAFSPAFAGGDQATSAEERMTAPPLSESPADVTEDANAGSSAPANEPGESQPSGTTLGDSTAAAEPERDAVLEPEAALEPEPERRLN